MPETKRKRGAQPGNRNASKVNYAVKAPSSSTPIPEDIDELLKLQIKFLSEITADLRETYQEESSEMTPEQKLKIGRSAAYVTMATLRVLKAKQLYKSSGEDDFSRCLNKALSELNEETEAVIARNKSLKRLAAPPFPVLPG